MSDSQVKTLVFNTRSRENGGDIFRLLEIPPLCMVQDSNFFFLQSNQTIINNDTQKIDRIVVFGNPSLFGLLAGAVQHFIDGTFRICLSQFYQCLIIMVFDVQTAVYVPILYVLMTGKHENLYWHALHWVFVASNWKLDPFSVTCDFEKGLHNAIRGQFTNCILNGCLFHWKQATRRKRVELNIDKKQIKVAMTKKNWIFSPFFLETRLNPKEFRMFEILSMLNIIIMKIKRNGTSSGTNIL